VALARLSSSLILLCCSGLDEELLAPTSRKQRWKNVMLRQECRAAYRCLTMILSWGRMSDLFLDVRFPKWKRGATLAKAGLKLRLLMWLIHNATSKEL